MIKFKTYMFSALALGTLASGFIATEALADHRDGRGRGYGKQVVDVYIDAGHQTRLEKIDRGDGRGTAHGIPPKSRRVGAWERPLMPDRKID